MSKQIEALKLALEALEYANAGMNECHNEVGFDFANEQHDVEQAITVIKEALAQPEQEYYAVNAVHKGEQCYVKAQPEQEPVAWVSSEELLVMRGNALGGAKDWRINVGLVKQEGDVGLYTTPPQRTWVGLTDEEMDAIYEQHHNQYGECESANLGYERAIEAKLKEKNT